ncbi:hypothetical protein M422DRAFT_260821, partial [Sphaerobolus stellatus SS14]
MEVASRERVLVNEACALHGGCRSIFKFQVSSTFTSTLKITAKTIITKSRNFKYSGEDPSTTLFWITESLSQLEIHSSVTTGSQSISQSMMKSFTLVASLCALAVQVLGSLNGRRTITRHKGFDSDGERAEVFAPILEPNAETVWYVGQNVTVRLLLSIWVISL